MYVVAGATGRVGSVVAHHLLADGAAVRVLVRRSTDAEPWRRRGAEARVVDLGDRAALADAVAGCAGFFTLLPFDLTAARPDAHATALVEAIAGAVADRRVGHVVMLSSGGADLAAGTGPITALHDLERALLATGTTLTALRACHFQEKVSDVLDAASHGVYPVLAASADTPVPMVATRDIGAVAARALQSPPAASESVDLVGPAATEREVATRLGDAWGRSLRVALVPEPDWIGTLTATGLPPRGAELLAELHRADGRGLLAPRGDRTVHTPTALGDTLHRLLHT